MGCEGLKYSKRSPQPLTPKGKGRMRGDWAWSEQGEWKPSSWQMCVFIPAPGSLLSTMAFSKALFPGAA